MAIRDNTYQDLIMNPEYMPNRLQNLEMYPTVDNVSSRLDTPFSEKPGFDFINAPIETSFFKRMTDPAFIPYRNNPRRGIIDNFLMQRGNPGNTIIDKAKSGFGKGINLGKTAISGIASLLTGLPGLGILTNLSPERDYRQGILEDFYSDPSTKGLMSQIPGMDQYNVVSGGLLNMLTGGKMGDETTYGLSGAIDKRMETIKKTLKKKKSAVLEKRLKDLQALKDREAKALEDARAKQSAKLESQRRGRRPGTGGGGPPGTSGVEDSNDAGGTGGFSYDAGGREGFGYGL
tara:strand:+ start:473 stop:1342 length:870 start_codon:yes stop_codon:yes gene_type:complete